VCPDYSLAACITSSIPRNIPADYPYTSSSTRIPRNFAQYCRGVFRPDPGLRPGRRRRAHERTAPSSRAHHSKRESMISEGDCTFQPVPARLKSGAEYGAKQIPLRRGLAHSDIHARAIVWTRSAEYWPTMKIVFVSESGYLRVDLIGRSSTTTIYHEAPALLLADECSLLERHGFACCVSRHRFPTRGSIRVMGASALVRQ